MQPGMTGLYLTRHVFGVTKLIAAEAEAMHRLVQGFGPCADTRS